MNSTSDLDIQNQINDCYLKILNRPVDPEGLHTYFSLIKSGKFTIEDLSKLLEKDLIKENEGKIPRILSSPFRVLPDFLIIGEHKCGTTSLFELMMEHPNITRPQKKEINFFNNKYKKGVWWYQSHFQTIFQKHSFSKKNKSELITGEATTHYLFHSKVAKRVAKILPTAKFIAILRNPVDRAYSQYCMLKIEGKESLSFEDQIGIEIEELSTQKSKIKHLFTSNYISRGIYVDSLKRWMSFFPKEQFLILRTEDLDSQPNETLNKIYKFLDLPEFNFQEKKKYNVGKYPKMNPETRKFLVDYFKPHNERLAKFCNRNFEWDN